MEFNNTAFRIQYEDQKNNYSIKLPIVSSIAKSIELVELRPLIDTEIGLFVQHPSNWKINKHNSKEIIFNILEPANSNFSVKISDLNVYFKDKKNITDGNIKKMLNNTRETSNCQQSKPQLNFTLNNTFGDGLNFNCSSELNGTPINSSEIYFWNATKSPTLYNFTYITNNNEFNGSFNLVRDIINKTMVLSDQKKYTDSFRIPRK